MARNKRKASKKRKRARQLYGPLHPWRLCPIGQHWVRSHDVHRKASRRHPEGLTFPRSGHCRDNPSHRDQLYSEEMENIAKQFFSSLTGPPPANDLGFDETGRDGNAFDDLIRGWTKYWNEILQPASPLDPNLVKALIATESSFDPNSDTKRKGSQRARGLMQITDATRRILRDEEGELRDHLITLTDEEAYDPNLNIAAGIRWLFQKRKLASVRLKRPATWVEGALEYKDMLRKPRTKHEKNVFAEVRAKLNGLYDTLNGEE